MIRALFISFVLAAPATADTVIAASNIRSGTVLTAGDLVLSSLPMPGAATDPAALIGMETRVHLYANRPIRPQDVGPPRVVTRNQIVDLVYNSTAIRIVTDARALGEAAVGQKVRVMNLSSKTTVSGVVAMDGTVHVN